MRKLSPSKQDYLEVIWLLGGQGAEPVSVSQIAERLDVKLPTVTRTVQSLARAGYVEHQPRGPIALTEAGRQLAEMLHHVHQDLMQFLTEVLGVPEELAESDAAQIEHCLSSVTAQRLHQWLEMVEAMDPADRPTLGKPRGKDDLFEGLPDHPSAGWRA